MSPEQRRQLVMMHEGQVLNFCSQNDGSGDFARCVIDGAMNALKSGRRGKAPVARSGGAQRHRYSHQWCAVSRHEIPARDPNHKVIVGWDHPLLTYFAQVIDRRKEAAGEDEKFALWVGTSLREIYEIDQLERKLRPFACLDAEIRTTLYGDKDEGR
jgi:hypothetical protein